MDYITAIMQKATELATSRDVKVSTEDIMFVVRKVSQCLDMWQPDQADWLATTNRPMLSACIGSHVLSLRRCRLPLNGTA